MASHRATFDQRTGLFCVVSPVEGDTDERTIFETDGYAGRGVGKNNPKRQHERGVGPLPRGFYRIVGPTDHHRLGPVVFRLEPFASNRMYGRSGFLIHGDSFKRPGQASSGCVVVSLYAREFLREFGVATLEVYASSPEGAGTRTVTK